MAGRGQYYKALYGGRGRGRGGGTPGFTGGRPPPTNESATSRAHKRPRVESQEIIRGSSEDLVNVASRLNGKSYPAYRDMLGSWKYPNSILHIQHIQADPYAPPSKFRLQIQHEVAEYPPNLFSNLTRSVALCDYLARRLHAATSLQDEGHGTSGGWSAPKGGGINVDVPGQQVLQRTSVAMSNTCIEARFTVSLPARGRTILGDQAAHILRTSIPEMVNSLLYNSQNKMHLQDFVDSVEDQEDLREQVKQTGLVAFIANGAILPRLSGASDLPMSGSHVVPFQSPPDLERSFTLRHRGVVCGMGIPSGITMIAGGGFHGKSTLLDALSVGCYNHIPGDGREFVVTSPNIVSIQGEDGRSIKNVDISPFISNLPGNVSTTSFSTQDASGSTSMAAGVIEALELGADTLLFDEDTCATNFLIRDLRMQKLIAADPITPLIFKVRAMKRHLDCSSILVIGGCGDYCDVADLVLEMRNYQCHNITEKARQISKDFPSAVTSFEEGTFGVVRPRVIDTATLPSSETKVIARKRSSIDIGSETLSLTKLPQLVHDSQTRAIVSALKHLADTQPNTLLKVSQQLELLNSVGLGPLMGNDASEFFLAKPRMLEVGMAINRLRSVSLSYMDTR